MPCPPDHLYKFQIFSQNTIASLVCDRVYFADYSHFNDPFDCDIEFDHDLEPDKTEALLRKVAVPRNENSDDGSLDEKIQLFDFLTGTKSGSPKRREAVAAQVRIALMEELKSYGVLCLTPKLKEPLMWAHYAASHQGLCFEYEISGTEDHLQIQKVEYKETNIVPLKAAHAHFIEGKTEAFQTLRFSYQRQLAVEFVFDVGVGFGV